MDMKKGANLKKLMVAAACFAVLVLVCAGPASAYNWPWDQGHDCVETAKGNGNWGKYDYDGKFTKNTYSSKECCELYCKICPVYANTGRYQKTFTDLTVPGLGPALDITRTYNSQEWSSTLMGYGWTFNFGRKLIITRNKAGEKLVGVLLKTGEKNYYREDPDGELTRITEYGANYELVKDGDNAYAMKYKDGTWYELREDGKIARILDRNRNALVFTYNSVGCLNRITNASGNYVDFILGANGKVASVSDNLGRTVAYGYDENGNLTSVTDPLGNTVQYVYNSKNYLVQIIDARGNTVESVTYDSHEPPRVSVLVEKGESFTIAYFDGRTEKSDSNGNKWTYYFNDAGVIQKTVDPLGNEKKRQLNKVTSTSADWEEDLNGNRTSYTYDSDGNISSKTDPLGNVIRYTYLSGTDLVETETDPLGRVTKYQYDEKGNLTAEIRGFGETAQSTTAYGYDSHGNQTTVTGPMGNITTYAYDENGALISKADPLGNVTAYTYDSRGNRLTETDALNNTTYFVYDLMDRLVSMIDALGNTTSYSYDANGNKLTESDPNGNTRSFVYDAFNRLVQDRNASGHTTRRAYDYRDNRISKTDARGNTTTYFYDIRNYLLSETDALGGEVKYTYDKKGNLLIRTDRNGNTTTYAYDANDRKVSELNAASEVTTFVYGKNGKLINRIEANGNVLGFKYDILNRLVEENDSAGITKSYTYNPADLVSGVADALGNATTYAYDENYRLIQLTDPSGNATTFVYDTVGNMISTTDREGNTVGYTYDALRRKISESDRLGGVTSYAHDAAGNIVSGTDAQGNITRYAYDSENRIIEETYADLTKRSYAFDEDGNKISRQDQSGQAVAYHYDALGRLVRIDYPGLNDSLFSYDSEGNVLTADNGYASVTFTYDNLNRLTRTSQNGRVVGYSYDNANGVRNITYPGGKVVTETRTPRGLLNGIVDGGNLPRSIVQYSYDSSGRLLTKDYFNGIRSSSSYDANGNKVALDYDNGATRLIALRYGHDKEGNRLHVEKVHAPSVSEQYVYDDRYRVVQFKRGALNGGGTIAAPVSSAVYNLDALGNWTRKETDGVPETRTHNEMNELTNVDGASYAYNDNGALAEDAVFSYTYDFENRLTEVTRKADGVVIRGYKYDALGRRVERSTPAGRINYFYDEDRVVEEQAADGTVTLFVYADGIDDVVWMETGGNQYCYHTDALGSVVALTDGDAHVVEQYRYDAYGDPEILDGTGNPVASSAVGNPYMFTARRFDDMTGLQYNRYRYLSLRQGRWITRDPLGYKDSMNLYEYVRSNPVNNLDPFGLKIKVFTRALDMKTFQRFMAYSGSFYLGGIVPAALVLYYDNTTVHCVLVVEKCDGTTDTWDYQSDSKVYSPAKATANRVRRARYNTVYSKYDKDEAVEKKAKSMKGGKYKVFSNNCCHWVENVLRSSGINWSNPNPWPFN